MESLASQAAVAFENADLIQRIRKLFDEFVHAAVTAVEQRDPTDLRPLRAAWRMLTVALAEKVDAASVGPLADLALLPRPAAGAALRALLHDFGKVAVQEKYLGRGRSSTPAR